MVISATRGGFAPERVILCLIFRVGNTATFLAQCELAIERQLERSGLENGAA